MASRGLSDRLVKTLSGLGLPVEIPKDLSQTELIRVMKGDKKKSRGIVHFSLPVKIGKVEVNIKVDNLNLVLEEEE